MFKQAGIPRARRLDQARRAISKHGDLGAPELSHASPATAEKVIRALVEAITFIQRPANKAAVVATLTKNLQIVRPEEAEEGYEVIKTIYERRVYPNIDGINNAIHLLGIGNEKIRNLKAANLVDDSFVKKLEKEGLF